jgi:hypothetical protein
MWLMCCAQITRGACDNEQVSYQLRALGTIPEMCLLFSATAVLIFDQAVL